MLKKYIKINRKLFNSIYSIIKMENISDTDITCNINNPTDDTGLPNLLDIEDKLNIFSLTWEEKDLVIWDNRCTAYSSMGGFNPGQIKFTKVEAGRRGRLFCKSPDDKAC
jgi:hypothetical protein